MPSTLELFRLKKNTSAHRLECTGVRIGFNRSCDAGENYANIYRKELEGPCCALSNFSRTTHFSKIFLEKNFIPAALGSIPSEDSMVSRLRAVWYVIKTAYRACTEPFFIFFEFVGSRFGQRRPAGLHRHCGGMKKRIIDQFFLIFFRSVAHAIVVDDPLSRTGKAPGADIQEVRVNLQCPE